MRTVEWAHGKVRMIDQTLLPMTEKYLEFSDYRQVAQAIKSMQVRGAPAIGVSAALGIALAAARSDSSTTDMQAEIEEAALILKATRPTAVNLFWAIDRMLKVSRANGRKNARGFRELIIEEAVEIQEEDVERNRALGEFGAALIDDGDTVLTHCNAGALACAGYGTAVGVLTAAWEANKKIHVFVDETRPLLQGARLTAWELTKLKVPMTLITDNMAGHFMKLGKINKIVVGADRIAANGDTANKIGTYSVAVLAKAHKIPFYVAAPTSTIDPAISNGDQITIEQRAGSEVTEISGCRLAPKGVAVANPAFDVTPHELIAGIVTETGVARPPFSSSLTAALNQAD